MSKIVCVLFILILLAPRAYAGGRSAILPTNIDVQGDLRHYMETMLQRSSTFRQQCQRLDIDGVHVQIRTDTQLIDRPYRARSVIQHAEHLGWTAWVSITPFGDPTQWIAHELEHVIEQLEGVQVPQLALTSTRDAWHSAENMFETERAMRVGRTVFLEVRDAGRALAHAAAPAATSAIGAGDD